MKHNDLLKLIKEIVDNDTHVSGLEKRTNNYLKLLNDFTYVKSFNNFNIMMKNDNNEDITFIALDENNEKVIAILKIFYDDYSTNSYKISETWTDQKYRNKGIMKNLIIAFVEKFNKILSDEKQTTEAKKICGKSLLTNNSGLNPIIYDKLENKVLPYTKDRDDIIWNNNNPDLLVGLMK